MERELAQQYIGKLVRISIGEQNFVPPQGVIMMVTDDNFLFQTNTKTSVLPLRDLNEISPVV
jgi:hypothetical protein